MALFLEWEQIAAGPRHRRSPLERTAGPDAIWRFAVFSLPDLDQKDGLNEADISPLEQGTLLPPPSPALAFPTLPNVHPYLDHRLRKRSNGAFRGEKIFEMKMINECNPARCCLLLCKPPLHVAYSPLELSILQDFGLSTSR